MCCALLFLFLDAVCYVVLLLLLVASRSFSFFLGGVLVPLVLCYGLCVVLLFAVVYVIAIVTVCCWCLVSLSC